MVGQLMTPVGRSERIAVLDVLRGAALFGIIVANMRGFAGPLAGYIDHTLMWTDPANRATQALVDVFISGKFITLFSFMFGIGFAIQMDRAAARGLSSRAFYLRRLGVLLLFGLIHLVLVWWGDILTAYAVMGFALFLFRNRSQKTILRWAAGLYVYPIVIAAIGLGASMAGFSMGFEPTTPAELQRIIGVYGNGSYAAILGQNIAELPFTGIGLLFFYPRLLGVFLFGLWVWREGIVRDLASRTALLRRCQKYGLWVGLVFNVATVAIMEIVHPNPIVPSVWGMIVNLTGSIGVPAGSLFYASTIALLWQDAKWRERLQPFGAVGRTALTNYLLQSAICTTIFYSWGGGLYAQVGPLVGLVLAIAIYTAQVLISVQWVRRFNYGPMEWLWRLLTYGRTGLLSATPGASAAL